MLKVNVEIFVFTTNTEKSGAEYLSISKSVTQ